MALRDAIYSRLSGFSGIASLVGTRIYIKEITQATIKPCLFFEISGIERISVLNGDSGTAKASFRVISIAKTSADAIALSLQVKSALQRYSGTISGTLVKDIFIENEYDAYYSDVDESNIEQYFTINYIE